VNSADHLGGYIVRSESDERRDITKGQSYENFKKFMKE